jgi:phenylacetate-coenzyme A ligase PaaK-like adenylate-forming protein
VSVVRRTPLDAWIAARIGCERLDRSRLEAWQAQRLRETVTRARRDSAFYAERLAGVRPESLRSLTDLAGLSFTTAGDLAESGMAMLCVRPSAVSRIVTLPTSGTGGPPKRVQFTEQDLELTVDFFARGMSTFTGPGDTVLVCMPGERPGSIGELLGRALPTIGARVHVHGQITDVAEVALAIRRFEVTVLVGIPAQVLALARSADAAGDCFRSVRAVLLSADRTGPAARSAIEAALRCEVFDHYGTTEMGFGGGVECEAHAGYHLREADLLFEVLDRDSGLPAAPGETGEVVVTTLTRTAMPLIRYRTGDLASWSPAPCACGTSLRLLRHIEGRIGGEALLAQGVELGVALLDEALLPLDGLADYVAAIEGRGGVDRLRVTVRPAHLESSSAAVRAAQSALARAPELNRLVTAGLLEIDVLPGDVSSWPASNGMTKRVIKDLRRENEDA